MYCKIFVYPNLDQPDRAAFELHLMAPANAGGEDFELKLTGQIPGSDSARELRRRAQARARQLLEALAKLPELTLQGPDQDPH